MDRRIERAIDYYVVEAEDQDTPENREAITQFLEYLRDQGVNEIVELFDLDKEELLEYIGRDDAAEYFDLGGEG